MTLQDIKDICATRNLSIDCILGYLAKVKHHESFASLSAEEKTQLIFDQIEAWSRTPERNLHLQHKFGVSTWANNSSHAIGKQIAKVISSEPIFASFI